MATAIRDSFIIVDYAGRGSTGASGPIHLKLLSAVLLEPRPRTTEVVWATARRLGLTERETQVALERIMAAGLARLLR